MGRFVYVYVLRSQLDGNFYVGLTRDLRKRFDEPAAEASPVRFSSKFQDGETDLVYYGYRFYLPAWGRWLTKDPIEEFGGDNLLGFLNSDAVNRFDLMGLITVGFYGADVWWKHPLGNNPNRLLTAVAAGARAKMFRSLDDEDALEYLLMELDINWNGKYDYCDDEVPIKIFGWSWGGITAVKLARMIKRSDRFERKEIELVATVDPVSTLRLPPYSVPNNVKHFWNRYQRNGVGFLHGRALSVDDPWTTFSNQMQLDPLGREEGLNHALIVYATYSELVYYLRL